MRSYSDLQTSQCHAAGWHRPASCHPVVGYVYHQAQSLLTKSNVVPEALFVSPCSYCSIIIIIFFPLVYIFVALTDQIFNFFTACFQISDIRTNSNNNMFTYLDQRRVTWNLRDRRNCGLCHFEVAQVGGLGKELEITNEI